jgi:hypothetical protein
MDGWMDVCVRLMGVAILEVIFLVTILICSETGCGDAGRVCGILAGADRSQALL